MNKMLTLASSVKLPSVASIKKQMGIMFSVQATPYEVELVMGYLKHKPEDWVVLAEGEHPWFNVAKPAFETLLRNEVPEGNLIFLLHLTSSWMMVGVDKPSGFELIPAIFVFNEHGRDGLNVTFYRIFAGITLTKGWISELSAYFLTIFKQNVAEKPKIDTNPQSPYVVLDLGHG